MVWYVSYTHSYTHADTLELIVAENPHMYVVYDG